jgi:hypothetical protein
VVEATDLFESLKAGQIPLITYAAESGGETKRMSLFRYQPGLKYVAISHVWSDKLGNPLRNGLPRCQLQRLQRLVDALYEPEERPVPFWIDTISCPTEPEEATDLAIMLMRKPTPMQIKFCFSTPSYRAGPAPASLTSSSPFEFYPQGGSEGSGHSRKACSPNGCLFNSLTGPWTMMLCTSG